MFKSLWSYNRKMSDEYIHKFRKRKLRLKLKADWVKELLTRKKKLRKI